MMNYINKEHHHYLALIHINLAGIVVKIAHALIQLPAFYKAYKYQLACLMSSQCMGFAMPDT